MNPLQPGGSQSIPHISDQGLPVKPFSYPTPPPISLDQNSDSEGDAPTPVLESAKGLSRLFFFQGPEIERFSVDGASGRDKPGVIADLSRYRVANITRKEPLPALPVSPKSSGKTSSQPNRHAPEYITSGSFGGSLDSSPTKTLEHRVSISDSQPILNRSILEFMRFLNGE